jgi:dTDP-4-amino-4,6-dideoxygalactose transaminase
MFRPYCGGNVVFCNIDKDTYLLDMEKLKQMLASKPNGYYKGFIPVDFAGYPNSWRKITGNSR